MRLSKPKSRLVLILSLGMVAGCSYIDPSSGVAITGHVTYQGKPISYGVITFSPPVSSSGRPASAPIIKGRYSIRRDDGPFPGELFIQIVSLEKVAQDVDPTRPPPVSTLAIPKNYNFDTSLKVSLPKRSWMSYSFDLK